MSGPDDLSDDMAFFSSTDRSERLITGLTPGSDLPDESARAARLLTALRSPTASDGVGEQEAVASIVAAIAAAPMSLDTARRSRMRPQAWTAKVAAVAGAVLLMGTGAAAATGSLPAPAQRVVSDALDRVDVSVPHPEDHADGAAVHGRAVDGRAVDGRTLDGRPGGNGAAVGPDATGSAMRGLCTAWAARGKDDTDRGKSGDSVAFTNLRHTAHSAGMFVKDYCHDVLTTERPTPGTHGETHPPTDEPGKRGQSHRATGQDSTGQDSTGQGSSGDHHPMVDTPNSGGIGTGATGSLDANDVGVDHSAPPATSGSSNAGRNSPTSPSTRH